MPSFLTGIPFWLLVLGGIIAAYIAWKWVKHRKANPKQMPKAVLTDTNVTTLRDNPKNNG
jgi:hypothetical protein